MIVRASVVARETRLERIGGESLPFTFVTLQRLEALKGAVPETLTLRLPGGRIEDVAWWVPGTPVFSPGQEVVLMLAAHPAHPGQFRLTELGLSRFDLVTDDDGRRFAVRAEFSNDDDLAVSKRAPASGGPLARDAGSFLAFLRAVGRGERAPEIAYARPSLARADGSGTRAPQVGEHRRARAGRLPGQALSLSLVLGHRRFARRRPQGFGNADEPARTTNPSAASTRFATCRTRRRPGTASARPTCARAGRRTPATSRSRWIPRGARTTATPGARRSAARAASSASAGRATALVRTTTGATRPTSRPRPGPFRCAR